MDARALPARGFYGRNIGRLALENVRLSLAQDDLRPVLISEDVGNLDLLDFKFDRPDGVSEPLVLNRVGQVRREPPGP